MADFSKRFWSKVDVRSSHDCWPWRAYIGSGGYGRFMLNGSATKAHRVAYCLCNGEIPKTSRHHDTVVMHSCDNPACCNPKHLILGTQADNVADKVAKNRQSKRRGEDNAKARLTLQDVLKIRADMRVYSAIAIDYAVSKSAITGIKNRRSWAWL